MASRSKGGPFLLPILLLLLAGGSVAGRVGLFESGGALRRLAGFNPGVLRLPSETPAEEAVGCEMTYGMLPCSTTVVGNLFLLVVYGFFMLQAAKLLSTGSEMLLEILGPGIVGGLLLPILGALPDAILIFVSGISGSKETAQEQVLIGMGLLAGSTVMLLTTLWGSCIVVGKCDLSQNSEAIDGQDTKGFSLTGSGVSTDVETSHSAKIMIVSVVPFIIAQLPVILKTHSQDRLAVLVALIVAVIFLLSYCIYQIYQPWIQMRRLAYARHKHMISRFLVIVHRKALGHLLNDDGSPNRGVIEGLFKRLDADEDGAITAAELGALIIGHDLESTDQNIDEVLKKVMKEFDTSQDNKIDREEFIKGMFAWLDIAKTSVPQHSGGLTRRLHDFHIITREEHDALLESSDEVVEAVENPIGMSVKAVLLLLFGTVVALVFADPLVDAVSNFSDATHIPSFFISFIAMPLATNSSEAVSAIIFASRKKQRTSSLTFSEIYGGVTMNNTLCLAVFLALVYARGLTWDFSSEVLIILLVCVIMGLFTSFCTTFPLWTSLVAFLLYPLSLAVVYVLDFVFGWS